LGRVQRMDWDEARSCGRIETWEGKKNYRIGAAIEFRDAG